MSQLFSQQSQAHTLRDYQLEAVGAVEKEFNECRGTLVILPTGAGKTQVACELIRRNSGRCLFLAHRDELIQQASKRIEQFTGTWPDIEQSSIKADRTGYNHVVASIQTLSRKKRLERFDPDEFDLIVIDEVHHATATTYRRIIDYFNGKILGITATPDRLDKASLGQVVDSVAYRYIINDAISDGWLCNVVTRIVRVSSMDFSGVRIRAGDLDQSELDKIMALEENLHAVAKPTVECAGDRKTIVFTTSVAHAERLAEIIDRYAGKKSAFVVHGETPKESRRKLLNEFHRGEWQFFVNVQIATEGYDEPGVSCISVARPTKSRALYSQMIGRGLRGGRQCPVDGKQDCLILDFTGNSGKHDLASAVDALGGNASPKEIERAKKIIEKSNKPESIDEAIEKAKNEFERARELSEKSKQRRKDIVGEVSYQVSDLNPFAVFKVKRDYLTEKYGMAPATERQVAAIHKWMGKHAKKAPRNLSKHEASKMLQKFADRREKGLATYPQVVCLTRKGVDASNWSFHQASSAISWFASNGWNRRLPSLMMGGEREPGEDG